MTINIVKSRLETTNGTSLTTDFSSGSATACNLLLLIATKAGVPADPTSPPADYTLLAGRFDANNDKHTLLYGKKAVGGETNATVTYAASSQMAGELIEIAESDVDNIIATPAVLGALEQDSGSTGVTSQAAPSIDPPQTGAVLMIATWLTASAVGATPGITESYTLLNDPSGISARTFSGYKVGTNLGAQAPVGSWNTSRTAQATHFIIPELVVAGVGQPFARRFFNVPFVGSHQRRRGI